jgi:hypothetical protein
MRLRCTGGPHRRESHIMDSIYTLALICVFTSLLVANFVIQFYVGARVYGGGANLLRSLNGTKTFIRGWRDPSLRSVMIVWSGVVGVVTIAICFAAILAAMAQ